MIVFGFACAIPTESAPPAETAVTAEAPSSPTDTADGVCAGAPQVTWNSFGAGFILESCQGCHATTAPERYGAPEGVVFDTVEHCWDQADRILARAAGVSPTMPPQGGTTEDDRTLLTWWLTCATPGT